LKAYELIPKKVRIGIMVWGIISPEGVGPLIRIDEPVTSLTYIDMLSMHEIAK